MQEKSGTENIDKLKKSEKIEKNYVKEIKEKESSHGEKSTKDTIKVAEKSKEREKDKEKEKNLEKEKHSRGEREKEKDKEKQRHKHKKKDKKDRKDDNINFKDRDKDREKSAKKDEIRHRSESKDHEKNGVSFESPSSITEIPTRKKSRSPSPIGPSIVPRDKPPQRPLKKLLDQLTEHSSSDSELSAPSPDEVVDSKSPTSAVKPEINMGTTSKLVGIHKSSSLSGSKQKDKSSSRKEKKERKDKEQGEKTEKDDANKKRKRKSSSKLKQDDSEPTVKTPRIEELKRDDEEEVEEDDEDDEDDAAAAAAAAAKGADEDAMDVEVKGEVQMELCKSEDDDDGSGSGKEEFGAPPAPECFTPDYVSQLKDLQHKIMTLEDNTELQRVVQVIAETGQYEITKKTFDFDLCALDRRTVKRLQDFFTASS
ncbi:hypothetical protein PR048_020846 [Dryococelus australis]|uniref:AF-9 ANC1 homology domain-containing protein n=1 Tax=Dryococelus australis TaxID=614101 RepID=A0ABQ9GWJ4_9NEOP|nr:hypothetical protein PR048_020846 [Dryococelus australis]